jgi:hypothetical protein
MMVPYLKGLHLTIDGWRKDRDQDCWKIATAYTSKGSSLKENISPSYTDYPPTVKPAPRLAKDLEALDHLTHSATPPIVIKQSKRIYIVKYGFGDASGGGFGSSIQTDQDVDVMIGTWNEVGSNNSSNFRELANFVTRMEKEACSKKLRGSELFLFTDNDTAQSAYYNGTSSSKLLFELV